MNHPSSTDASGEHGDLYVMHESKGTMAENIQWLVSRREATPAGTRAILLSPPVFYTLSKNMDDGKRVDDYMIEKEISYSINFSQDLLYNILNSYIVNNYNLTHQYYDMYDENNVRTRIPQKITHNNGDGDDNCILSVKKCQLKNEKFVHWLDETNTLVPLVWRESSETRVSYNTISAKLHKIIKVNVYKHDGIEIKFEHIYFSKNDIDSFDSMMASKIAKLLKLLESGDALLDTLQNSQLGSDEILARIRLEYEFENDTPEQRQLNAMCKMIVDMEAFADKQNIAPCVPYTTLLDKIVLRKFSGERIIVPDDNDAVAADAVHIKKWALKLDGMRGRGLMMRNFCLIQTDDMQFYSTKMATPMFKLNNVVTFQCEIMNNFNDNDNDGNDNNSGCNKQKIYITDILQVFRYNYNNRTQYECNVHLPYALDALSAIKCINYLHRTVKNVALINDSSRPAAMQLMFQHFFDPPISPASYTTIAVDGYVVLDDTFNYIKYKWVSTMELEYDSTTNTFNSLSGPLTNCKIIVGAANAAPLQHGRIYECAINGKTINVLKPRPDRLIPN
ncbi:lef4 [Catopsilia pomona nucleopolyhedrovirus]|uniref:Lef4 n=1 Tax=Catopsilia pomona nucleopolyhedrovirus TaxID=1850906 RepID=A0A172WZD5_9ABAC|nr:lef4 [Catopsilia pomona nucleopolyhedrovirus]ANF29703.1 lef4 [Catopsilia pomona nucleopolyhedrovirus]